MSEQWTEDEQRAFDAIKGQYTEKQISDAVYSSATATDFAGLLHQTPSINHATVFTLFKAKGNLKNQKNPPTPQNTYVYV